MSLRRITAIYVKDLLDAVRDARILITLLTPLMIGVFYSFAFSDDNMPPATLVVDDPGNSALVQQISDTVSGSVDLTIDRVERLTEVQQHIADDDADVGLVIPEGFDAAVAAGDTPTLQVLLPASSSIGGQYILATLDPILRSMAGQQLPANVTVEAVDLDPTSVTIIDKMSMRTWSFVLSLVLMISMVSLLAIPIILAEETEKKTIDALVLVSSYGEVVIGKALLGGTYVLIMTGILLGITRLRPVDTTWFLISIVLLAACLLGFGLLLGSVFKSATQLNTWSGLLLIPAIIPASLIGMGLPSMVDRIAGLTPTGAGMKLLTNAFSESEVYAKQWQAIVVLLVWSTVFFALLLWQLSRRRS
ncbi:MAG: ABC transporter permease [Thermomicrobiales bacterium]|nr:MAG: ABC transporter permease [Thermomicrobiales bacterium]